MANTGAMSETKIPCPSCGAMLYETEGTGPGDDYKPAPWWVCFECNWEGVPTTHSDETDHA
jgi:hypothetical protein